MDLPSISSSDSSQNPPATQKNFGLFFFAAIIALVFAGAVIAFYMSGWMQLSKNIPNLTNPNNPPIVIPSNYQFPDLIIHNTDSLGGLGRLVYDKAGKKYSLVDFKFTPYVVESTTIRPMDPEEGGGTMAIPSAIKSIKGAVFAMIPSYNTLLKLDADFSIIKQKNFDSFEYIGSLTRHMDTNNGAIFFFKNGYTDGDTLIAYDENLKVLGQIKMTSDQDLWANFNDFIIAKNKLYFFEGVETGPVVDCPVPEPNPLYPERSDFRCGARYDIIGIVDITDPRNMRVEKFAKITDDSPPPYLRLKGVDPQKQEWIMVEGYGDAQTIQFRAIEKIEKIITKKNVSGKIAALTDTAPFYAIVKKNDAMFLVSIKTGNSSITIGDEFDIKAPYHLSAGEDPVLKRYGDRIFIASGNRLRVINIKNAPQIEFSQDFADSYGKQFSITDFDFGDQLAPAKTGVDKKLLKELLSLDYYGRDELHQVQNQISRLTPSDTWAIPLLAEVLRKEGSAFVIRPIAVEGLGNIGPAAHTAIPEILDASMQGAAILGDTEPVALALQKIDPEGKYILPELVLFEKRNYVAGARQVSKEILLKLKGPATQEALKSYQ